MDGIELEILWSNLIGIVSEQAKALQRIAFSPIVREAGDLANALFDRRGLAWRAPVIGGRSGWVLGPSLPRNAAESRAAMHHGFAAARKLFFANRGVWDAIASAGPGCSFQHGESEVDLYLEVSDAFLAALGG